MFTALTLSQRLQLSLLMAMVFLLILGSNRMDKKNYAEINKTVNSVYKDRVVVQGYIYELDNIFHRKELRLLDGKTAVDNTAENEKVAQLLTDFAATELTVKESALLNQLNDQFDELKKLEREREAASGVAATEEARAVIVGLFHRIEKSLDGLTEVQIDQGNRLTIFSQKSMDMITMLSNIEVTFMVLIAILILILVFYPSKAPKEVPLEG